MANVKDLLVNGSARIIGTIYGNATSATNSDKLDGKHLNEIASAKSTTLSWNTSSTIATIGGNNITITMPANPNTDTHYTTGITAGETGTTSNSATTNGNTFIKIKDNSIHRGQIKLVGSGATSVSSDANGVITISSTDNNTTYGSMSVSEGTTGTATTNRVLTAANLKGIINAHAPTKTGSGASGTWDISISGNAATSTIATRLYGGSLPGWGTFTAANGYTNVSSYDYGDLGAYSIAGKGGQLSIQVDGFFYQNEGRYLVLDSNNYTNYAPTKTGSGASGTWGINVTGSAGSVAWGNITGKPSTFTPSTHNHDSSYAKLASPNNMVHSGNEWTVVPSGYSDNLWLNYRTCGGLDGNITAYYFGNGNGGTSGVNLIADSFSGNASSATKATQDGNGNVITTEYVHKTNSANTLNQFSGAPKYLLGIEAFADGGEVKWQDVSDIKVGSADIAATASKVKNKLTVGSKTYDGSAAVTIAASDLGLASAMLFLGTTTTAITDGAKTNPVAIGGSNKTVTAGNVVLYGSKEFVWTGSAWEELGNEGSYKIVQAAVTDPNASGTSNTFIATISQDANGKITATKKTVAVTNSAPTLAWGTTSTIGTVAGTNLQVKMPANPNTDTKNTAGSSNTSSKIFLVGATSQASNITTYSHDTTYVNDDEVLVSSAFTAGINHIIAPKGGQYYTQEEYKTGYLKITLPVSWNNMMMRFYVDIYNYQANTMVTYMIGGYNYISSSWINVSAIAYGRKGSKLSNLKVHFGHDGSKCAIYIGSADTTWTYPQVMVRDILVGFGRSALDLDSGWSIGFTTTLGTITATVDNPYIGYNAYTADNVAWSGITSKPSYYDAKAIKSITRSGTTFTATHLDGTTSTFTQQDNNTVYSHPAGSAASKSSGLYKFSTDSTSHISGVTAVTKADITALGIPGQDTNTWRPVVDNLTSTATDSSLSANQGKVLKGLVDGKAPSSHTHTKSQITDFAHTHDDRYYTESEINSKLNGKATITTLTNQDLNSVTTPGFYNAGGSNSVANKPSGVDNFGLIVTHNASGNYYTQILYYNNISYRRYCNNNTWTSWTQDKLTDTNTWRGIQNNLTSDSTTDSLSAAQGKALKTLIDGKAASSHTHDDRYYTESEINTKLNGKSDTGHTHDNRYYTESEIDTKLNGKANTSHTHDNRYYTESEINTKINTINTAINNISEIYYGNGEDTPIINEILNKIYPVGSVYLSVDSTNPSLLFGGTWEPISQGRALFGAGTLNNIVYTANSVVNAGLPDLQLDILRRQDSTSSGVYTDIYGNNGYTTTKPSNTGGTDEYMQSMKAMTAADRYMDIVAGNPIYGNSNTVQPNAFVVYMWKRVS